MAENQWRIQGYIDGGGLRGLLGEFIERVPQPGGAPHKVRVRVIENNRAAAFEHEGKTVRMGDEIVIDNARFIPREGIYKGQVYIRPLDRGINLQAGPHPDFGLDDLATIVGLGTAGDSGHASLEIIIRLWPNAESPE